MHRKNLNYKGYYGSYLPDGTKQDHILIRDERLNSLSSQPYPYQQKHQLSYDLAATRDLSEHKHNPSRYYDYDEGNTNQDKDTNTNTYQVGPTQNDMTHDSKEGKECSLNDGVLVAIGLIAALIIVGFIVAQVADANVSKDTQIQQSEITANDDTEGNQEKGKDSQIQQYPDSVEPIPYDPEAVNPIEVNPIEIDSYAETETVGVSPIPVENFEIGVAPIPTSVSGLINQVDPIPVQDTQYQVRPGYIPYTLPNHHKQSIHRHQLRRSQM